MKTLKILGIKISVLDSYLTAYNFIQRELKNGTPDYVVVNNVHTVIEGVRNKRYMAAIDNACLSFPDGKPLSFYAKLRGEKNISRIFGPTFMEKTLDWSQKDSISHYFFGSSLETLDKMKEVINSKYLAIVICGMASPPFKKFTEEENKLFLKQMNESGADIFWIGLGAPKQEIWMYENYKKLNHGIMIGIGAGFDYLAGNTKHAPEWMKNMALEWLYRLIQEPRRLWKRYLITNSLFLYYIFLEMTGLRKFDK